MTKRNRDEQRLRAEFLVEPFTEGKPGPHVAAAVDAFTESGMSVELGPFASSAEGDTDEIADAVGAMIRASMRAGATAIRVQIGGESGDLVSGLDLHHALDHMVRDAERSTGVASSEWTREQKQFVVRELDERGAFLLRGAVDDIAEVMGVSRITIYNYLNAIE